LTVASEKYTVRAVSADDAIADVRQMAGDLDRKMSAAFAQLASQKPGGQPAQVAQSNDTPRGNGHTPGEPLTNVRRTPDAKSAFEPGNKIKPRFLLQPFSEITLGSQAAYLIKGIIPREGLVVVYGEPKCGKSFWTFDLSMHIALGWDYRGWRVKQGAVVYCAFEGAEGFKARVEAFRQKKLSETATAVPFYLLAASLVLAKDRAELIQSIRAHLGDTRPAVVVLDTLNRSIGGSESDDRDMPAYIAAAGAIQAAFNCAVIIVHHSGLAKDRPRGHTSLTGAADAQIVVKRDSLGDIVAAVDWLKDGAEGEQVVSRLLPVDVVRDDEGDPITSCIVEAVEGQAARRAAKQAKSANSLTKGAKIALEALHEVIGDLGKEAPASGHIPAAIKVVTLKQWRDAAYRRGISSSDKDRAREMAFQRAHESLLVGKRIGVWDDHVWVV
jgi:hypothetical protein